MREVNAVVLGRMAHDNVAEKIYTTVTALFGRPSGVMLPTQDARGRAPSLAMENIRRDATRIIILVD